MNKKRYELYAWYDYEALGGRNDYIGTYSTYVRALVAGCRYNTGHINGGNDIDFDNHRTDVSRWVKFAQHWNQYKADKIDEQYYSNLFKASTK